MATSPGLSRLVPTQILRFQRASCYLYTTGECCLCDNTNMTRNTYDFDSGVTHGDEYTDQHGSMSNTGSISENPRYDGPSANDVKFEGEYSGTTANTNTAQTGWGA